MPYHLASFALSTQPARRQSTRPFSETRLGSSRTTRVHRQVSRQRTRRPQRKGYSTHSGNFLTGKEYKRVFRCVASIHPDAMSDSTVLVM